jgi:CHAT domain-containing protein
MEPVLAALPAATSRLTLLPAGSTRLLPLHAAVHRRPDGHASALLDRVVVSYTPNLHALRAARRRPAAPVEPVLVVGDPVDLRFSDLELAAVRQHFPAAGPSAETTAAVRDALPGAGLVHLACHGLADRDDPARSRLLLADGELSVQEILRLAPRRDRPARLVVLSACESATIGDVLPDEAVSLPVALAEWGASAVVGSLWRVADESTAIMIRHFYDAWRGPTRPTLPAALATAQRRLRTQTNAELLAAYPEVFAERARAVPARRRATWEAARRYDDPYFWAPFLILGR